MRNCKFLQMGLLFCAALGMTIRPAWSQASLSTVRGTLRDQTGAVIAGATVSLTNTATSVASETTSNEVGSYVFPAVLPGAYRLTVVASGMKKFEASLTVQVQQVAVVDPTLTLGEVTETIDVKDVTPLVTTDNGTIGHVLERQRISQLPINGRSILNLLPTIPGLEAANDFGSDGTRAFGIRQGSHEFVLDGAALTERMWGGIQRRPPGLDTIEEFKVETNNSSAKFTRPVTVVMSTRSGTNELHGSAFETHRNNSIGKARRREDFYTKPPQLIRNEFGASAGGPVFIPSLYNGRNKSFWFFAYEGLRNTAPVTRGFQVPTVAMRNGDFRGLVDGQGRQIRIYDPMTTDPNTWQRQQFSYNGQLNVIDPVRISPLAKQLFAITPLPTLQDVNPLVENNWFGPVPNTTRQWTVTTRIDHRFSDRDQVYVRYTQADFTFFEQFESQPMLNGVAGTHGRTSPSRNSAVSWVRTFSPTLSSELLVSVSREKWRNATGEPLRYTDQLGLPNPLGVNGWPGIYSTGLGSYFFETDNEVGTAFTYGIVDQNMTKILRNHTLQFGGRFRYDQMNIRADQQQPQGNHNFSTLATALYDSDTSRSNPLPTPLTGHNLANMFLGVMNYSNRFVRGDYYLRGREYALYFQDNYKLSPRFMLNLGLRWEYWPAFREKNNVQTGFDRNQRAIVLSTDLDTMYRLGATTPSIVNRYTSLGVKFISYQEAGLPRTLMETSKANFGPRLGFAYRALDGARSFVLRGGYRISYFPMPHRTWTGRSRLNTPLTARFRSDITDPALSPDGIRNYGLRTVPSIIAGSNSRNAVTLDNPIGLERGSAFSSYFDPEQPESRVQDWNVTVEKEVLPNTVFRASYIGNHVSRLEQYDRFNEWPSEYVYFVTTGQQFPGGEFADVAGRPYDQVVYGTLEEFRKTGWSNFNGIQFELERKSNRGYAFQVFYTLGNALTAGGQSWSSVVPEVNQFLPGAVPANYEERNRFLSYQRDTTIPKHRLSWNWVVDLPFGKGKLIGQNAGSILDRFIGGWQLAGIGSLRSNYFDLPTDIYPTGQKVEIYGTKYPIQDCRSGQCFPGYLWWNGYIPANQINSVDANGKPSGVMGVPANYRPAGEPLIPWPKNPDPNDPLFPFYGSNTVFVPLKDGTIQRTTFNDGLHPWRQQYFPGVRQWGLDASLFKTIPVGERVTMRLNADFFNVLNRPGLSNSIGGDGVLSRIVSGQAARELQLTLRLTW